MSRAEASAIGGKTKKEVNLNLNLLDNDQDTGSNQTAKETARMVGTCLLGWIMIKGDAGQKEMPPAGRGLGAGLVGWIIIELNMI
jgi:hypothetical protein